MIYKGDQYYLQFTISHNDESIDTDDVDGVKLKLGKFEFEYPDNGLTYDSDTSKWKVELTQAMTYELCDVAEAEVKVKFKDSTAIKNSPIKRLAVKNTLFKEVW